MHVPLINFDPPKKKLDHWNDTSMQAINTTQNNVVDFFPHSYIAFGWFWGW